MWKWKEPVKLKTIEPIRMHLNSLSCKIPANYQFMYCRMDAEELLHVFSLPPEYIIVGNSQEQIFQNNLFHNIQLQIDFINQFINRISLEERKYQSYQDRVFITALLNRIGITDQQGFIRQLQLLFKERNLLIKLSSISQNEIQKKSLENTIYKRIHQQENIQKMYAFLQHTQTVKERISFQEAAVLEQQRQIDSRVLTQLKEKFLKIKENISLLECGMYISQKKEKKEVTDKDIFLNLSATILLNLTDMAYGILSKKRTNSFIEFNEMICSGTKLYAEVFFTKNKTQKFSDYKLIKQLKKTREILSDAETINLEENKLEYSIIENKEKKVWQAKEYLDFIDQKNKEIFNKISKEIHNSEENFILNADKKEIRKQALRALENQEEVLKEALSKTNHLQIREEKEIEKYLSLTDETTREFYQKLLDRLYFKDGSHKKTEDIIKKTKLKKTKSYYTEQEKKNCFLEKQEQKEEELTQKKIENFIQKTALEKTEVKDKQQEHIQEQEKLLLYQESKRIQESEKTRMEQNNSLQKYEKKEKELIQKEIEELAQKTTLKKTEVNDKQQEQIKGLEELLLYQEKQNSFLERQEQKEEDLIQKKIEAMIQRTTLEKTESNDIEQEQTEGLEELLLHQEKQNSFQTEETKTEQTSFWEKQEQNKEELIAEKIEAMIQRTALEKTESNDIKQEQTEGLEELLLHQEKQNSYQTEETKTEQTSFWEKQEQNKEELIPEKIEAMIQRTALEKTESNDIKQEKIEGLEELLLYQEKQNSYQTEETKTEQTSFWEKQEQNKEELIPEKIEAMIQRTALEKTESNDIKQEKIEGLEELLLYQEKQNSYQTEETKTEQTSFWEKQEQNEEKLIQKKIEAMIQRRTLKKTLKKTKSNDTEKEQSEEAEELLLHQEKKNSYQTEETRAEQKSFLEKHEQVEEELIQKEIENMIQRKRLEKTESNDIEKTKNKEMKIHSVELVHKLVQNNYEQEEIKKMLEEQMKKKDKISQDNIVQNQRYITEIVTGNIKAQVAQLSEQVYQKIEKKLQNERKRRGY